MEKFDRFWQVATGVLVVMGLWLGFWNVVYDLYNWIPVGFSESADQVRVMPAGIIGWTIFLMPALMVAYEAMLRCFWPDEVSGFWDMVSEGPVAIMKRAPIIVGLLTWISYAMWNGLAFWASLIAGVLIIAFMVYMFIFFIFVGGIALFAVNFLGFND